MKAAARSSDERQFDASGVLCTGSQTYHIRQVHSSNSVFVAGPSGTQSGDDSNLIASPSLCAIAQCTATLELSLSSASAISFLRQKLPQYTGPGHTTNRNASPTNARQELEQSKICVFDDAPFSTTELDLAWKQICACEIGQICLCPTAPSLIEVWKSIISAVILRNIDLEAGFAVDTLLRSVEEEGHPASLIIAVIFRLARPGAGQSEDSESFSLSSKTT